MKIKRSHTHTAVDRFKCCILKKREFEKINTKIETDPEVKTIANSQEGCSFRYLFMSRITHSDCCSRDQKMDGWMDCYLFIYYTEATGTRRGGPLGTCSSLTLTFKDLFIRLTRCIVSKDQRLKTRESSKPDWAHLSSAQLIMITTR